jgi:serine/threonine-protein kinase RsbW
MPSETFVGRLENVSRICEFAAHAARDAGLDEKAVYAVELAVDEACTNIIEHSYGSERIGNIECTCEVTTRGIKIILRDFGRAFNPDDVPVPNLKARLQELQSRGAGLFLIKKLMDEVKFEFSETEGNRLTLVKKR